MIEALTDRLQRCLLPSSRGVAGRAALGEAAVVRIFVAIRAQVERNADILRFPIWAVGVALFAFHLRVQTGQRIACLAVVELAHVDCLPVDEVVTRLAVRTEATLVKIFVAGNAGGRQTQKGAVQVLVFDCRAFLGRNSRSIVTLVAFQAGMLALKRVSGFPMVERLGIPLD